MLPKTKNATTLDDMAFYFKNAKAQKYVLGLSLHGDKVLTAVIYEKEEFRAVTEYPEAVKLQDSSERRQQMSHEPVQKYRLYKTAVRQAVWGLADGLDKNLKILRQWTEEELKPLQKDFKKRFNCKLTQKEEDADGIKVYTYGDFFEFLVWCELGENPNNWHKNCRSYRKGTDCGVYEVKSCYWAPSTIDIRKNQYK